MLVSVQRRSFGLPEKHIASVFTSVEIARVRSQIVLKRISRPSNQLGCDAVECVILKAATADCRISTDLPPPGCTDQAKDFALANIQRQVIDHGLLAKSHHEIAHLDRKLVY